MISRSPPAAEGGLAVSPAYVCYQIVQGMRVATYVPHSVSLEEPDDWQRER